MVKFKIYSQFVDKFVKRITAAQTIDPDDLAQFDPKKISEKDLKYLLDLALDKGNPGRAKTITKLVVEYFPKRPEVRQHAQQLADNLILYHIKK